MLVALVSATKLATNSAAEPWLTNANGARRRRHLPINGFASNYRIETIKPLGVTTTHRPFCWVMVSIRPIPGRFDPGVTS